MGGSAFALGLAILLLLAGCSGEPAAPARRVLLISVDTLRADHLGHYGYRQETSPNLDAFAREGVVFDQAFASSPMTLPSISSMLTGRLPFQVGVSEANHLHMPSEITTLAEIASRHGVTTGAVVSNWVLRKPSDSTGPVGVSQGFGFYDDHMQQGPGGFERRAEATTDAAIAWLDRLDPKEPALFWVHYQDPHGPYTPPESMIRSAPPAREHLLPIGTDRWGLGQIPSYQVIDGQRSASFYVARYDAEIRYVDREIARLLDALRARHLYEGSLILFTADHGESLGEHDYWFSHGEHLYADLVRIPFVIRYPEGAREPRATEHDGYRRSSDLVGLRDVFATALAALGIPAGEARGVPLFGRAVEAPRVLTQHLLAENIFEQPPRPGWISASDGRYRLVARQKDEQSLALELFDTRSDPGERRDRAAELPSQVRRLRSEMGEAMRKPDGREWPKGVWVGEVNEEERARLRALGYVD